MKKKYNNYEFNKLIITIMLTMLYYIYKMLLDIQHVLHQCPNIYIFRVKGIVRPKLISVT